MVDTLLRAQPVTLIDCVSEVSCKVDTDATFDSKLLDTLMMDESEHTFCTDMVSILLRVREETLMF